MSVPSRFCRIVMLGALQVVLPDRVFDRFRTQKTALLLAYLAHHANRTHPREQLIALLWPDADIDAGRDSLTTALTSLRRQLEPAGVVAGSVLEADRQKVRLNPAAFTTDVAEFERLLAIALSPGRGQDAPERARTLQQAVDLYRGEFLAGHYEDWVLLEQTRLSARYGEALLTLAELREQTGDLQEALGAARKALSVDPYYEGACHLLMRLQARQGQPIAAMETYRLLEQRFRDDLNAAPGRPLRDLAERIRRDPEAFQSATVLAAPQEAPSRQPAPAPPPPPPAAPIPALLPLQMTGFFGREREVQQLVTLLHPGSTPGVYAPKRRLVTLTGPGGVGKSRLAIETARELASSFAGGVWFVSLADVPHPRLLPFALAHALQIHSAPNVDLLEQIVDKLNVSPALLLLDNYEHLLQDQFVSKVENPKAADASVLARLLLERAPQASLLVTSRRALSLVGEQEFPLDALSTPAGEGSLEALLTFASVALYQDRAQYVLPDFAVTPRNAEAVSKLCRKLEGMPLALEMAAAWVKTLPPPQMLAHLEQRLDLLVSRRRDLPARQRSLRATIEWSYDLLSPELQKLFAQLAVFHGGWDVEAAAEVCGLSVYACLEGLSELQQHSLAVYEEQGDGGRYRLLETLRQFGWEKLATGELEALRRRHLDYYLSLAQAADPHLTGADAADWFRRLEMEHDNLRAALAFSLEDRRTENAATQEAGLCLCVALYWFWYERGYWSEGRSWHMEALRSQGAQRRTAARGKALTSAGHLALFQADYVMARSHYEEALAIWTESGDKTGISSTWHNLGHLAHLQAEYTVANSLYTQSLALRKELGDPEDISQTLNNLANIALEQRDFPTARQLHNESLLLRRESGSIRGIAQSLNNLAFVHIEQGDFVAARPLLIESLTLCTRHGLKIHIITLLEDLALLLAQQERPIPAARLYGASAALREAIGAPISSNEREPYDQEVAAVREVLGKMAFAAAWEEGRALSWEEATAYAGDQLQEPDAAQDGQCGQTQAEK